MFNMFSGGALSRFSVFALGVIPYISASIVFQMMGSVIPSLQGLRKEGESGKRKMTMYTRYATVGLAAFQSFGIAVALQGQVAQGGAPVVYTPGFGFIMSSVVGLTAGTMFLMWLGEQMTERGIGNGISLLIFAGIVAGLPGAVVKTLGMASNGELTVLKLLMVVVLVLAVTAFVVFMERAQRRITVNYARRSGGQRAYMNQTSHLPLKINMAGVIPPIFASSLLMFPATAVTQDGAQAELPESSPLGCKTRGGCWWCRPEASSLGSCERARPGPMMIIVCELGESIPSPPLSVLSCRCRLPACVGVVSSACGAVSDRCPGWLTAGDPEVPQQA
ncbi:MAG: hypothetical protein WDW36_008338 [Sanguina aurantia]